MKAMKDWDLTAHCISQGFCEEPPGFFEEYFDAYAQYTRDSLHRYAVADEQTKAALLPELGNEWLDACGRGNPKTVQLFINGGMDVNYQDPDTKETALHRAAKNTARYAVFALVASGDCNHLLRDRSGLLASECAPNGSISSLLRREERLQTSSNPRYRLTAV